MLIKAGVDISRLERNTRRSLNTVARVFAEYDQELVITSTYEGNHSAASLHYANQAYDIRLPKEHQALIYARIQAELPKDFDIVKEGDHIHIEYDPKR